MSIEISDNPDFRKLAARIVGSFESTVDETCFEEDEEIPERVIEVLEEEGENLRGAVEAAIDDAYYWGASAFGGLIGMAIAIRNHDVWTCEHIPGCAEVGVECHPDCVCGYV